MIHAYPKRMWYVEQYLIPSMLAQGIDKASIIVYNDVNRDGNLLACMKAFASVTNDDKSTWHLQDDVLICRDFKKRTEEYDSYKGVVCGFSSLQYDGDIKENIGSVNCNKAWFSFPCIHIPNQWARGCAEWVQKFIIGNPVYERFWKDGVNDDWAFKGYLKDFHSDVNAINLSPCLVDHVDYLIGGGSGVKQRKRPVRAQYWTDDDLVKELAHGLDNHKDR